jgi:hypothetical protein
MDKQLFKDLLVGTYIRVYRERPTATKLIKKISSSTAVEVSHETARKWLMGTSVPSLEMVLNCNAKWATICNQYWATGF